MFLRYSVFLKARPTCEVQSEGDEAVIARQELQRLLPLHQSPKVICQGFTIEEVVDANQEVPDDIKERELVFLIAMYSSVWTKEFVFFHFKWEMVCVSLNV